MNKWLTLGWKQDIVTVTVHASWVFQTPPKTSILHLHQRIKFSLTPWPGLLCSILPILQMRQLRSRRLLVIYRCLHASCIKADPKQRQIRPLCFPASEKHEGDPFARREGRWKPSYRDIWKNTTGRMQWHESPLVYTDVVHTDVVSTPYLRPYCLAHEGSYRMKRPV